MYQDNAIKENCTQTQAGPPVPEVRCPVCFAVIPPENCYPKSHCLRCGWIAT